MCLAEKEIGKGQLPLFNQWLAVNPIHSLVVSVGNSRLHTRSSVTSHGRVS